MQPLTAQFKNILIAEDDNDDYLFFAEALDKIAPDMRLHRAKNGLECINMIKADTYDLIFLDLNMPIKNGLDCLKFIESHEPAITRPVVIYSTSHYLRDIDASFKMGAHYYIIKPADADQLPDVLTGVFTRFGKCLERPTKEEFVVGLESNSQLY